MRYFKRLAGINSKPFYFDIKRWVNNVHVSIFMTRCQEPAYHTFSKINCAYKLFGNHISLLR